MTRSPDHPIPPDLSSIRQQLAEIVGPAPWYWETFPAFQSAAGQRFVWTYHGDQGPLGYLLTLVVEQEPDKPRLALNTYCRPFLASAQCLGVWCPEGRSIRLAAFAPDQLKVFDLAEIAGWFKQSSDRIYSASPPVADFEVPLSLKAGMHKIDVPPEFAGVDELIVPTSYKATNSNTIAQDDPAFALFVIHLQAGLVEVLPQKWFTAAQYEVGKQWITRAGRDRESHRIFGECFGVGTFLLEEDGCRLAGWVKRS